MDFDGLTVENFESMPRKRGAKASNLLQSLRSLNAKQKLRIPKPTDTTWDKFYQNVSSIVHSSTTTLSYKPTICSDKQSNVIEVYREEGSDYATDNDGNPVLSEETGRNGNRKRLTNREIQESQTR